MSFITDDFLLHNKTARALYKTYAEPQPILDYHCHLPPADVAANRRLRQPLRDLARGRSLQMARHARERRPGTLLHRRCRALRQVPRLGRDGAEVPAQSALTGRTSNCGATSGSTSASTKSAPAIWKTANEQLQSDELAPTASCGSSTSAPSAPPTIRPSRSITTPRLRHPGSARRST